jgi:PTH1 family peptidyl-tRNA hydrolase
MAIDVLKVRDEGASPGYEEHEAWVVEATLAGESVLLVKPLTFMNRSGVAVERLLSSRSAEPTDLVVILDDVALDLGVVRVRERGSHGGHNGLRSILDVLGTDEVPRVRLGIRKGDLPQDLADYVLSDFPKEDVLVVQEAVGFAADAAEALVREGAEAAMNRFNGARKA